MEAFSAAEDEPNEKFVSDRLSASAQTYQTD